MQGLLWQQLVEMVVMLDLNVRHLGDHENISDDTTQIHNRCSILF